MTGENVKKMKVGISRGTVILSLFLIVVSNKLSSAHTHTHT